VEAEADALNCIGIGEWWFCTCRASGSVWMLLHPSPLLPAQKAQHDSTYMDHVSDAQHPKRRWWTVDGYMGLSGVSVGRMRKSVASVGWSSVFKIHNSPEEIN
jgi:hypothetical protein